MAALWILVFGAGLSLALVFLVVSPDEGRWVGLLTALATGALAPFVLVHVAVWSEPLYLPLVLSTLLLMIRAPHRPVLAGSAAALSVMVRYLGLAAVGSVGVWTFLKTRSPGKALAGMAPGAGLFIGWWLWTRVQGESVRTLGEFSVPLSGTLSQLPDMLRFWLAPGLPVLVAVVLFSGVIGTHFAGRRSYLAPVWLLILAHLILIVLSRLVVDQRIPFDTRVFLPVLVLATLPVVPVLWKRKVLGPILLLVWLGWVVRADVQGVREVRKVGLYYTASGLMGSELVDWLIHESDEEPIYSNEPELVVFHGNRSARRLPLRTEDVREFLEIWRGRPGAILVLPSDRPDELDARVYQENLPLRLELETRSGLVLVPASEAGRAAPGALGEEAHPDPGALYR